MSYINNSRTFFSSSSNAKDSYDTGLRAYMIAVYKNMCIALLISAFVALFLAASPNLQYAIFSSPFYVIFIFAPVALAIYLGARLFSMSASVARNLFFLYSGVLGVSLSSVFLIYTGASVVRTLFITASLFGGMSIYGYATKRDLSSLGSFAIMGVWGIFLVSLVNLFLRSSMLDFVLSAVGVIAFTALAAYDTQKIKDLYYSMRGISFGGQQLSSGGERDCDNNVNSDSYYDQEVTKIAIYGAFCLYLDFINLFVSLLRFVGNRRAD